MQKRGHLVTRNSSAGKPGGPVRYKCQPLRAIGSAVGRRKFTATTRRAIKGFSQTSLSRWHMKQLVATETDIAELSSLCSAGNSSILVRHGQSS